MKRYLLLILVVVIFSREATGQETGISNSVILVNGLVMDAQTRTPLSGSQIIINRSFITISDDEGKFAFYVNRADTVVFVRLGYKSATFFVSDTLSSRELLAGVYMSADTITIGEVVIVPKLAKLRSELYNPRPETKQELENAKYNLQISAYQGRISTGRLGDPASNYEMIRQKQKLDTYEKGGIPSDRMVGISPLILIPAAYLLMNGLPEKPPPPKPSLTDQEVDQLNKRYMDKNRKIE